MILDDIKFLLEKNGYKINSDLVSRIDTMLE